MSHFIAQNSKRTTKPMSELKTGNKIEGTAECLQPVYTLDDDSRSHAIQH